MVATNGIILRESVWEHEWLPYVFYRYQDPVSGFYSSSVVEQVLPYQIRLNEINDVIRDAQDIMGRPRILVAEGSRVNPMEVDNVIGRFIKYTGIKPEAVTWSAINAELYNERDRLVRTCMEHFGLSQMATTVTHRRLLGSTLLPHSAGLTLFRTTALRILRSAMRNSISSWRTAWSMSSAPRAKAQDGVVFGLEAVEG